MQSMHCEEEKAAVCCLFPQYGSPPPPAPEIRPSCIRHTRWGPCCAPRSQAGHHTHSSRDAFLQRGDVLGRMRTLAVAPPAETPPWSPMPHLLSYQAFVPTCFTPQWLNFFSFPILTQHFSIEQKSVKVGNILRFLSGIK